jgi:transmembrane sensor
MRNPGEAYQLAPENVEEIEMHAADWLARRVCDDWTEAQQTDLDSWLSKSPAHRIAFLRLDSAWRHTYRLSVLRHRLDEHSNVEHVRKNRPYFRSMFAVLMAVSVVIAGLALYLSRARMEVFATPVGGHKTINLADGSQIELNTDTSLRARLDSAQRTIWLDKGEAYFQIRHDPARPFVVMADGHRVLDIGTKFLVRRNADRLEVSVVDGRVQFDVSADVTQATPTVLMPGDVMVATANSTVVHRAPLRKLANELSWRHGLLAFENARLADVVAEFNRYNDERLIIASTKIDGLMVGGTFPTTNVKAFTDLVQDVLGLHVERRGNETVISR